VNTQQQRLLKTGRPPRHGETGSPTWIVWMSMNQRCNNPNHKSYKDYGGRGIKVCERWKSYENFVADVGYRPAKGLQLDRIDNERGYEPGNCCWATPRQNCNNRRSSRYLEFGGERLTVAQWADRLAGSRAALKKRIQNGWSVADALTRPFKAQRNSAIPSADRSIARLASDPR
jgi:hypothetical protein